MLTSGREIIHGGHSRDGELGRDIFLKWREIFRELLCPFVKDIKK